MAVADRSTYEKTQLVALNEYHQSRDNLDGLPPTTLEHIPLTNAPNIFSYKSYVFAPKPELV
jgi:hypothetical protein